MSNTEKVKAHEEAQMTLIAQACCGQDGIELARLLKSRGMKPDIKANPQEDRNTLESRLRTKTACEPFNGMGFRYTAFREVAREAITVGARGWGRLRRVGGRRRLVGPPRGRTQVVRPDSDPEISDAEASQGGLLAYTLLSWVKSYAP
jgi:hypothetical protein